MILNEEGKREFLKSNFHPYFDIALSSDINEDNIEQSVNFVLPISVIDESYSISEMSSLFNDTFTNVIFSSGDDQYIYQYECYQQVYFIKMHPFQSNIRMHIIPKKYNASDDSVLFFKDIEQSIEEEDNFECTIEYERHRNTNNINLYYLEDEQKTSSGIYFFDIREYTRDLNNLQINMGYIYNNTNPTDPMEIKHYTGILDESDNNGDPITQHAYTEFNAALMSANYDQISTYTNTVKQQKYANNDINWPTDTTPYDDQDPNHNLGFDNMHNIDTLYHQTIKYFNDDIYIEEDGKYLNQNWTEPRE